MECGVFILIVSRSGEDMPSSSSEWKTRCLTYTWNSDARTRRTQDDETSPLYYYYRQLLFLVERPENGVNYIHLNYKDVSGTPLYSSVQKSKYMALYY
jgi:hypothetical protein